MHSATEYSRVDRELGTQYALRMGAGGGANARFPAEPPVWGTQGTPAGRNNHIYIWLGSDAATCPLQMIPLDGL
jgi:hypothetical protein